MEKTMQRLLMQFRIMLFAVAGAGLLAVCAARAGELSVPYVPTPQSVVDRMLAMAKVTAQDYLIDLGSGDGRIVVTAAKKFGTRGFGVDLNPERIREAAENARRNGVANQVAFYQRNLFDTDLSQATVITMYLLPRVNLELRPRLLELKPGTRLVSHDFDMGDWKADEHVRMDATEKYFGSGGDSDVYLWIVPAKTAGVWRSQLTVAGKVRDYEFRFEQKYQEIRGTVRVNGRSVPVQNAKLRGAELSFAFSADLDGNAARHELAGRIDGSSLVGQANVSGRRVAARVEWLAERAAERSAAPTPDRVAVY